MNKIRPVHEKLLNIKQKLFSLHSAIYTNIDKLEIILVLHDKVALLTRRRCEYGTRNCEIVSKDFLERFGPDIICGALRDLVPFVQF